MPKNTIIPGKQEPEQKQPRPKKPRLFTWDRFPGDEGKGSQAPIDWQARQAGGSLQNKVEQLALAFKEPLARAIKNPHLNPFYYSDTIAFFLLIVVALTGVYIWLFYEYGFDVSYQSIERMDRFFVSRAARAVHRYASGGLVIFSLIHAIRMFFTDRFRGARWLAWLAGMATFAVLWITSITGYVMIWDEVAQILVQTFLNFIKPISGWASGFYLYFLTEQAFDNGYVLMLILLVLHLGLPVLAGLLYWYHIKNLSRPKFFPPRYWMVIMTALMALMGLIFPTGLLPRVNFTHLPTAIPLDSFFLFYVPVSMQGVTASWIIWGVLIALTVLISAIPWLWPKKKVEPAALQADRCTGCGNCAADCPYKAITMLPRDDDTPFKEIAQIDPKLCVSCGICVGSCDTLAISLGSYAPELLAWQVDAKLARHAKDEAVKVIYTCERHAAQGGRAYLQEQTTDANGNVVEIIPVTCVGMVNPGLIARTLDNGASEVELLGCPPDDCASREGNVWLEARLNRERSPKLKRSLLDAPIHTSWLAPDQFKQALSGEQADKTPTLKAPHEVQDIKEQLRWQNLIPALVILTLGLALQVALTYLPYAPYPNTQAMIDIVVQSGVQSGQLTLEVDNQILLEADGSKSVYQQVPVSAGEHAVRLSSGSDILFDKTVTLGQKEVLQLAFDGDK